MDATIETPKSESEKMAYFREVARFMNKALRKISRVMDVLGPRLSIMAWKVKTQPALEVVKRYRKAQRRYGNAFREMMMRGR